MYRDIIHKKRCIRGDESEDEEGEQGGKESIQEGSGLRKREQRQEEEGGNGKGEESKEIDEGEETGGNT